MDRSIGEISSHVLLNVYQQIKCEIYLFFFFLILAVNSHYQRTMAITLAKNDRNDLNILRQRICNF